MWLDSHLIFDQTPTLVFCAWSSKGEGLQYLAFEKSPAPADTPQQPSLNRGAPWDKSLAGRTNITQYSRCSLQQVVEITSFVENNPNEVPVTGLLVRYEDGHYESLGSCPPGCSLDPVSLGAGDMIHIAYRYCGSTDMGDMMICAIGKVKQRPDGCGYGFLVAPRRGSLIWVCYRSFGTVKWIPDDTDEWSLEGLDLGSDKLGAIGCPWRSRSKEDRLVCF